MKTLVATFGWADKHVISSLIKYGFEENDKLILLIPQNQDKRSRESIEDLKRFLEKYSKIKITELQVNLNSFEGAILKIIDILSRECLGEVVINLSGGMRALILITYIATLLIPNINKIEVQLEDGSGSLNLPSININSFLKIGERMKFVLQTLLDGEKSLTEIAKKANMHLSSTHRILIKLAGIGLAVRSKRGRIAIWKLTPLGMLFTQVINSLYFYKSTR